MAKLQVIIFDVEHGFCGFVKSPTGCTLLIDCGRSEKFSPIDYLVKNEFEAIFPFEPNRLTQLIVSHPHDDHIEDIENLAKNLKPRLLLRQSYNWEDIKQPSSIEEYRNLEFYSRWQNDYSQPVTSAPDWGISIQPFFISPEKAKNINKLNYVNNSSIVVIVSFKGSEFTDRFLFAGDMEKDGWDELLKREDFQMAVKNVHFFVAPHHGHTSGFSTALFELMGRPIINIVSAHSRDENVDGRYSSQDFASGTTINGEVRRMLSTRSDGSIFIDVHENGKYSLHTKQLESEKEFLLFPW